MILYRPVGLQELELIYDSGMKAFPARLPEQPIFYPVLDLEYARQIASDWNARSGQFAGYVTQFKVEDEYINRLEVHTVGGTQHQEYWIPAEELETFNKQIVGHIKVVDAYFGDGFQGFVPDKFGLQGKNAGTQFTDLANTFLYKRMDFYLEIKRNHKAIYLNYPYWQKSDFKNQGLKEKLIQAIRETWLTSFPKTPLVDPLPKEPPPAKQVDPQTPVGPADEAPPPVRKTNQPSSGNAAHEQPPPIKKFSPRAFMGPVRQPGTPANPVHKNTPPVNKPDPPSFVNHDSEENAPLRQAALRFGRGLELGLDGKYQEAIDELSRAVEAEPRHVPARISLGVAFHRTGEDDRALSCYEAVLKLDPKHADAHYFRANILHSREEVREAIKEYTTAIGLKPELIEAPQNPVPQDRLTDYTDTPAGIYRIARHARRILELNKLLEANPRQANLFKERASEYARLENYEQAITDCDACLALNPGDAGALHLRGQAYEQMGQPEYARKDYQRATANDPQLAEIYINRGVTFGSMGQFRQSIDSLTEGIRLAPENANGYFNRGTTYLQLGDFENAITDFSRVIQLSSDDEDAYYWRGISHEEAGHRNEAIADYKQFLAISQNPQARDGVEEKLSQWNAGTQDRAAVSSDRQKKVKAEKPAQEPDLYELLMTLGDRALKSLWLGSDVDCRGEKADELYGLIDQNLSIQGDDLLRIASGIQRTVRGDFQAFDPGAESPWIFIRAWEGSGFYVETNDRKIKKRLKSQFRSIEEVKGAPPPYEGMFIHI
jgi:tetratricopeptide (TPR) repeat protein